MCQKDFDCYLIHIKRSFIFDSWAIIENRFREIAQEEKIDLGKNSLESASQLIDQAIDLIRSSKAKKFLKDAKNRIKRSFPDFPVVRDAVLKIKINDEKIRKEFQSFLIMLNTVRNASHTDFMSAIDQQPLNNRWYSNRFEKNSKIELHLINMENITNGVIDLFKQLEL